MNIYKVLLPILVSLISFNIKAQVTFDLKLSETSSKHKLVSHTAETNFKDSIYIKGYIAAQKKGICGEICAGGTIKVELLEKIEGYPHSYMYIITSCVTGETNKNNLELFVTKYTGKEEECYYKDVVEVIDSKGVPYYKISETETKKTMVK